MADRGCVTKRGMLLRMFCSEPGAGDSCFPGHRPRVLVLAVRRLDVLAGEISPILAETSAARVSSTGSCVDG